MRINSFLDFLSEATTKSTMKSDIKRFDGSLKHRLIYDNTGQNYNIWWSEDPETCIKMTKLYSGKFALDLGGYAPSVNDILICTEKTLEGGEERSLIIKTNVDNIIPDEVVIQAAKLLKLKFCKNEETTKMVYCNKEFSKVRENKIIIDDINRKYVIFTVGNVRIV